MALPLLLIGLSAVLHAIWNLAAKSAGTAGPQFVWAYSLVAAIFYAPIAIFLLVSSVPLELVAWAAIGVSALGHLSYSLLLQRAYATADLSIIYPVSRGVAQLLIVVFAGVLFDERLPWQVIVGAFIVGVGVFVLGTRGTIMNSLRFHKADLGFGLITAFLIATCNLWDIRTVSVLAVSPILLEWIFSITRIGALAPYAMKNREQLRTLSHRHWRQILVVGLFAPLSYILALSAFSLGNVSTLAPMRELSVVLGCVGAWLFFAEPQPFRRIMGATLIVAGVVTILIVGG